jgi:hypothetical protein
MIHGCTDKLVMLDPFLGIGHSALAAKQCKIRRFIGFDIDAEYVSIARISLETPTESTFEFTSEKGLTETVHPQAHQRGRRVSKSKDVGDSLFNPAKLH